MTTTKAELGRDDGLVVLPRVWQARLAGLLLLMLLAGVAVLLSLGLGAQNLAPSQVWHALVRPDSSEASSIVRDLRLPRTVLAVIVGLALGAAGALIQGHTANPLADPGLLGVSAGASAAVVFGVSVFGVSALTGYIWLAFAGAALASLAVFAIASGGRVGVTPVTLALAGVAISALLSSLTSSMLIDDEQSLNTYRFWVVGSLTGRGLDVAAQILPFVLVGLLLAVVNAPTLNALGLGEDVARGLGVRVGLARAIGLLAIVLLSGSTTAACGPIAFLGLVVPHACRIFTGPDHRWLIPYSAVLGVVVLLVADVVGRMVARPGELSTGIVLAFVGAPIFILILRRVHVVRI